MRISNDRPDPLPEVDRFAPGTPLYTTTMGDVAFLTGETHRCTREGCDGTRLAVRWTDGVTTYPCTRGAGWGCGSGVTWVADRGHWRFR